MTNLLKEKVFEKMNFLCTFKEEIIFENYEDNKENDIEIYTVIAKATIGNRFKIYKGTKYCDSISVEYFILEKEMFKAMSSKLKDLGEV